MNSVFSLNELNTNILFSFLAVGCCPKKLAFVRKIMTLPESGGLQPRYPLALTPIVQTAAMGQIERSTERRPILVFEWNLICSWIHYTFYNDKVAIKSRCLIFYSCSHTWQIVSYSYLFHCWQQVTHVVTSTRPAYRQPLNLRLPLPTTETCKLADTRYRS